MMLMNILISYIDADDIYHTTVARGWFRFLYVRIALGLTSCHYVSSKPIF